MTVPWIENSLPPRRLWSRASQVSHFTIYRAPISITGNSQNMESLERGGESDKNFGQKLKIRKSRNCRQNNYHHHHDNHLTIIIMIVMSKIIAAIIMIITGTGNHCWLESARHSPLISATCFQSPAWKLSSLSLPAWSWSSSTWTSASTWSKWSSWPSSYSDSIISVLHEG